MKIFFLTPTIDGKVGHDYCASMFRTAEVLKEQGIDSDLLFLAGCPAIDRARDILIANFMASDSTHLMQIDSDVGWMAEDIVRMLNHDVAFVAGVYPVKQVKPEFRVNFNGKQRKGLLGIDGTPGGFKLIKRSVIEKLMNAYPETKGRIPHHFDGDIYGLHTHAVIDGVFYGEDMSFCRKIREVGIDMWIDPTINLRHWSGTDCYDHKIIGNLVKMKEKAG